MNNIASHTKMYVHSHIHFVSAINAGCIALGFAVIFIGNDVWMLSVISFVGLALGGILGPNIYKHYLNKKNITDDTIVVNKFGLSVSFKDFVFIFIPSLLCTLLPGLLIFILYIPWMEFSIEIIGKSLVCMILFNLCISIIFSIFPMGSHPK